MSFDALVPYGWDDRVAALFAAVEAPDAAPARVVRVERSASVVRTAAGERLVHGEPLPAVGDWVAVSTRIDDVLPRWSALTRQDPGRDVEQVLAANVDVVLLTSPADRLNLARLERELVAAWESGAVPTVVVTKADLAPDPEAVVESATDRLVGVDVVLTSSTTGVGLDTIRARLAPSRTAVLLGPSGAGKSSLANALLGEEVLATGAVRADDLRGRHTTTNRQLVPVPTGGVLIDTPGLRALPLWRGTDAVSATFSDVEELAADCRFGDCQHDREPDCAVRSAVVDGRLSEGRLASYRKLQREVAYAERAHDAQAQRAERDRWKAIHKEARQRTRHRPGR